MAILALCGCDRTKAMEAQAQAAVARALPQTGAAAIDLLQTNLAQGVVCGLVTSGDAGDRSPFIVRGGAAKIYPAAAPSWADVRQLGAMDSGSDQAAVQLQIDDGCDFPGAWAKACRPAGSPIKPPDPQLCRLWKAGQFQTLFDHVKP